MARSLGLESEAPAAWVPQRLPLASVPSPPTAFCFMANVRSLCGHTCLPVCAAHFPRSPEKAVPLCPVKERTYLAGGTGPDVWVICVPLGMSEWQTLVRKQAVPLGQNALSLLGCSDSSFLFLGTC